MKTLEYLRGIAAKYEGNSFVTGGKRKPDGLWRLSIGEAGCLALARIIEDTKGLLKMAELRGILEIGTCNGVSTVALSEYGPVVTLDVRQKRYTGEVISGSPYSDRIVRIVASDQGAARLVVGRLRPGIAFVDGLHDYDSVWDDFNFVRRLARCVIFHDYSAEMFPGAVRAIDEIAKSIGLPLQTCPGTTLAYLVAP